MCVDMRRCPTSTLIVTLNYGIFKKIIISVDVSVSYPVSMVVSVLHILVIAYILILSVTATFVTRKMKMQPNQSTKNILTETKAFVFPM
jgi:hypothetical protein